MDDASIERYLIDGNSELIDREVIAKIEKKEYRFIGKYISSSDKRVKDVALSFLRSINQPWCYKWYMSVLDDPSSQLRAGAGDGILQLKNVGNATEILIAIEKEKNKYAGNEAAMEYLIKVVGNIGNNRDAGQLKEIVNSVKTDEVEKRKIQKALFAACVKLEDQETVQTVENMLSMGSAVERREALEIVEYTEQKKWIPLVVPLLKDQSEAKSFKIGNNKVSKSVCDYAANALLHIDIERKLPIEPLGPFPYTDEEIEEVKKIYGMGTEEQ